MTKTSRSPQKLAIGVFTVLGVALTAPALAGEGHKMMTPQDIKWSSAPSVLPSGAEAAVLYGDTSKEGMFALRLKLPKGYHIPPHMHPKPEVVTVISGGMRLGMGETADRNKAQALSAGSFFALPENMAHYTFADEDTVIQINSTGPWGLTYVNPKDDPRQKQKTQ